MTNYAAPVYNPYRNQMTAYQYPAVTNNPYATVQPAYIQPYNNQQTQIMPSGLRGRTVNTPDEITPQEVPMDGGYSFFPLSDGSAVYMKAWGQDGKINTFKYIPEATELPVESTPDTTTQIMERLDRIEGMLKNHNNHRNNQKPNTKEDSNE